ncbi:hypothetical protein GH810_12550 [Acetobacterium paludosum]|uniref:Putative amidase domain-containing protein n=1 Tax=Acetobacterium paludosum TaxID=52693 RepID=A0A923KY35_9FIRM|nr:amidase domain-containing protein [Acetobacterium paludosum]MBC3889146.1 hypothetical protein [Acetobacterium paludosum]
MRKRVKRKKRKRIIIGLVLITLATMGFACVGVFANSSGIMNSSIAALGNNVSDEDTRVVKVRDGGKTIDQAMLTPIKKYFETTFEATADLKTTDITDLFSDPSSENAQINQSALNYIINLRLNQSNDLKMTNYECGITISKINNNAGEIEVVVTEDHTVNFVFIPDVDSSSSGIKHTFYLKKVGNSYVITEHYKDEDSFTMIQEAVEAGTGDPEAVADQLLSESLANVEELSSEKKAYNSGAAESQEAGVDNKYDAAAAVKYAMAWVDPEKVIRNENKYSAYDEYGGNCNNYISQCLFAGGIPMDYIGDVDTQWKWYGETVDLDETDSGRSPAWTGVEEFYTYASENTGYGLAAIVDDNVFSGSAGDILQYGQDDEWLHSVIITKVITDSNGNMLDYLINSNTTDRINYPASAYGYSDLRLIKIEGWNEN